VRSAGDAAGAPPFIEGRCVVYARSTTITAQASRIDDGINYVNELMPTMSDIDGCVGMSLLVDRSSRRCIATTSWESESAMRASREEVIPIRERLIDTMGGEIGGVQEWEIAIFHRDHNAPDGAGARVTWARPRQGELDATVDVIKASLLPLLETQQGFCGYSLLIDRDAGLACGTASFDSMERLAATRDFAAQQRAKMAERTGVEIVDVLECELAVHHLRVPELV
jgi:quinol monooxygenase YgiN